MCRVWQRQLSIVRDTVWAVVGEDKCNWYHWVPSVTPFWLLIWFDWKILRLCGHIYKTTSLVVMQKAFCWWFNIPCNNAIPNANTFRSWVRKFNETGSMLRTGTNDKHRSIRTLEHVQWVKAATLQSLAHSAQKHAVALGMFSAVWGGFFI